MKSFSDLHSSRIAKQKVDHRMHMTSDLNPFGDATIHVKFPLMKKIIISTIVG